MTNLKNQYGQEIDAVFKIHNTVYKNYLAYIKCTIENNLDQDPPESFQVAYVYQGREYMDSQFYWIDTVPDGVLQDEVYHISVNKSISFNLRVNLFGGYLLDSHALAKIVRIRIYNVTDTKTLIWESSDIKLVSQPINTPTVVTEDKYKAGTLTVKHVFAWYSDQDFNYYNDDFHVVTNLLDALGQTKRTDTRMISGPEEVITFNNLEPGKYVLLTKLYVFTGYTMYTSADIKQLAEKNPTLYLVHNDKIYKASGIYVKVGTDPYGVPIIKQVDNLGVMDIIPKESV
jgi:hypothetical protein